MKRIAGSLWGYGAGIIGAAAYIEAGLGPVWPVFLVGAILVLASAVLDIRIIDKEADK